MRIVMVSVKKPRKVEIRIYAMYSYAEWPAKGKILLQKNFQEILGSSLISLKIQTTKPCVQAMISTLGRYSQSKKPRIEYRLSN